MANIRDRTVEYTENKYSINSSYTAGSITESYENTNSDFESATDVFGEPINNNVNYFENVSDIYSDYAERKGNGDAHIDAYFKCNHYVMEEDQLLYGRNCKIC